MSPWHCHHVLAVTVSFLQENFLGSSPGTFQCGSAGAAVAGQGAGHRQGVQSPWACVAQEGAGRAGPELRYLDGGGAALLVLALTEQAIGLHVIPRHWHGLHHVQTVAAAQTNQPQSAAAQGETSALGKDTGVTLSVSQLSSQTDNTDVVLRAPLTA